MKIYKVKKKLIELEKRGYDHTFMYGYILALYESKIISYEVWNNFFKLITSSQNNNINIIHCAIIGD